MNNPIAPFVTAALFAPTEMEMLNALRWLIVVCANNVTDSTLCRDAIRDAREMHAPSPNSMRPVLSASYLALREATGEAYEAAYVVREAHGLNRYETPCGDPTCCCSLLP